MTQRPLPGLGAGMKPLGYNPYIDPASLLNPPDPSQDTSATGNASPATAGSGFGEGLGSWLGALGMALLSSPRNAPFASLPQIMPAVMQQSQLRAAAAQQAKLAQMAPGLFHPQGAPSIEDLLGGASPTSPPVSNVGGGQAPQYPSTGVPNLSAGGALLHPPPPQYAGLIQQAADDNGIPAHILANTLWTESKYNPNAVSPKNAQGIGQFIPGTAARFGIDPFDPTQAIPASAQYLAKNRDMFGGNIGLALAGYNWGEGNVQKWLTRGANPAAVPAETRNYVQKVSGQPIEAWLGSGSSQPASAMQLAQAGPPTMTDASPQMRPNTFAAPAAAGAPAAAPRGGMIDINQINTGPGARGPRGMDYVFGKSIPRPTVDAQGNIVQYGVDPMQAQADKVSGGWGAAPPTASAAAAAAPSPYPATGSDALSAGNVFGVPQNATALAGPLPSSRLALDLQPQQAPAAAAAGPPPQSSAPAAQPAPTPQQVQQAQAFVQRPPPPSPDTVSGDLAKQRAAAIRYYTYFGDLALKFAPFGEAGKPYIDAAKQRMDLAKEILTEGQKKRLDAAYAPIIAQGTKSGEIAGQLGAAGLTDPNSPAYQQRALNMIPDTRPEAQRNAAFAYPNDAPQQQQVVAGSIQGNQPTDLQKAVRVMNSLPPGSPERRVAEAAVAKAAGIDPSIGGARPGVPVQTYDFGSGHYQVNSQIPSLPPGGVINPDGSIGLALNAPQAFGTMKTAEASAGELGKNIAQYSPLGLPQAGGPGQQAGQQPALPGTPLAKGLTSVVPPIREPNLSAEELKSSVPEWTKASNMAAGAIAQSQSAEHRLMNIADALKMVQSGSYLTQRAAFDSLLKTIGLPAVLSGDPAAVQTALHENSRATLQTLSDANKKFTQNEFQTISAQSENPNLQPEANLPMLAEDIAGLRQIRAMATDWRTAQLNGAHNFDAFRTDWLNANPLAPISDAVKQEIGLLKGMSGTPVGNRGVVAIPPAAQSGGQGAVTPPPSAPPNAPAATAPIPPVRVRNPAEARKLPRGTRFIDPDGNLRVRP